MMAKATETKGVLVVLLIDDYQALADVCASGYRMSLTESYMSKLSPAAHLTSSLRELGQSVHSLGNSLFRR